MHRANSQNTYVKFFGGYGTSANKLEEQLNGWMHVQKTTILDVKFKTHVSGENQSITAMVVYSSETGIFNTTLFLRLIRKPAASRRPTFLWLIAWECQMKSTITKNRSKAF
jgi:hypothetical protein